METFRNLFPFRNLPNPIRFEITAPLKTMADSTDLPPLGLMDLMPLVGMVVGIIVVLLYGLGFLGGSPEDGKPADKDGKPQRCESCCGYDAGRGNVASRGAVLNC